MKDEGPDHQTIVRYLLGTLPEEEQARLEQDLLRDDAAFEQVLAVEDDLLHDYAQGGLTEDERRRLRVRLLETPDGRQRLLRARDLLGELSRGRPAAGPPRWVLPAAAVLLSAGAAVWMAGRSRVATEEARTTASPSPVASITPPSVPHGSLGAAARIVALALAPGLARADAPPRRVTLGADVAALRLELAVPGAPSAIRPAARYRAVVLGAEGDEVWSGPAAISGTSALVEIPTGHLPEGDYELVLGTGPRPADEVAGYSFGVLRE